MRSRAKQFLLTRVHMAKREHSAGESALSPHCLYAWRMTSVSECEVDQSPTPRTQSLAQIRVVVDFAVEDKRIIAAYRMHWLRRDLRQVNDCQATVRHARPRPNRPTLRIRRDPDAPSCPACGPSPPHRQCAYLRPAKLRDGPHTVSSPKQIFNLKSSPTRLELFMYRYGRPASVDPGETNARSSSAWPFIWLRPFEAVREPPQHRNSGSPPDATPSHQKALRIAPWAPPYCPLPCIARL